MVFIKENCLLNSLYGVEYSRQQNPKQHYLHARSVSLKYDFFNIAVRCETAIKTNGPECKHVQLGFIIISKGVEITIVLPCTVTLVASE